MNLRLLSSAVLLLACVLPLESAYKCGVAHTPRRRRSFNSTKEPPNTFPWTAFVAHFTEGREAKCTGSLIHESYVLTAAHCVPVNGDASQMGVSFQQKCGTKKLDRNKLLKVTQAVRSSKYGTCEGKGECSSKGGDFAILKLEKPQSKIMPVCIGYNGILTDLTVNSWGRIDDKTEEGSECLRVAHLLFVDDKRCREENPESPIGLVMCAGSHNSSEICSGDSGAALMTKHQGLWYQVGVSSFGKGDCTKTRKPSGFERIVPHISLINKISKNAVQITPRTGLASGNKKSPSNDFIHSFTTRSKRFEMVWHAFWSRIFSFFTG